MKLSSKILKALNHASRLHACQTRKGSQTPYIVHPFAVACILSNYTQDEDVIVAGLLHDTLEDVAGFSQEQLKQDFGQKVLGLVEQLTEVKDPDDSREKSIATWKGRKEQAISRLKKASQDSLLITAADQIHNLLSVLQDYTDQGENLWDNFNATPDQKAWHYEQVIKILDNQLDNPIVEELKQVYADVKRIMIK